MRLLSLSEASIQPRTSLLKFDLHEASNSLSLWRCMQVARSRTARSAGGRTPSRSASSSRGERVQRVQLRALSQAALLAEFKKSSKRLPCGTARQRGRGIFRFSQIATFSAAFWKNPETIWSTFSKNSATFWQHLRSKN